MESPWLNIRTFLRKGKGREMAQWVKEPKRKLADLNLNPAPI